MMDKLFDGSDAHLLPGNAELIADLRERINPAYADQRGTESYERKQCADAIEASDKRIAELEQINCSKLDEAERKLAVAREAIHSTYTMLLTEPHTATACTTAEDRLREALAQIGGYDAR